MYYCYPRSESSIRVLRLFLKYFYFLKLNIKYGLFNDRTDICSFFSASPQLQGDIMCRVGEKSTGT